MRVDDGEDAKSDGAAGNTAGLEQAAVCVTTMR